MTKNNNGCIPYKFVELRVRNNVRNFLNFSVRYSTFAYR